MKNNRSVKRYVLLPKFQIVFVILNISVLMATCTFAYVTVNSSFNELKNIGYQMNLTNSSGYMKFIYAQESMFADRMLVYIILAFILSLVATIILSHKVAGPVYRIKKYFKDFDKNKPTRMVFRKGDFFSDIPEIVNDCFDNKKDS